MDEVRVGSLVRPDPPVVRLYARFDEIAKMFLIQQYSHLYVVDEAGEFRGAIALHDIKAYLSRDDLTHVVTAFDLLKEDFPVIAQDSRVPEALHAFARADSERLPVVAPGEGRQLVGSITKNDLLLVLAEGTEHATGRA